MKRITTTAPSLRTEIVLLCTVSILIVSAVAGLLAWHLLKTRILVESTTDQRNLVNDRARDIYNYMDNQLNHLIDISQTHEAATALHDLVSSYRKSINTESYAQNIRQYRPRFASLTERWQYYDLFLISLDGDIVFSIKHEQDFATNLTTGPYQTSGLAHVFRQSLQSLSPHQSAFKYYPPSDEEAAFMAVPVIHDNHLWGVIAIQLDTTAFFHIADNLIGLGRTGEIVMGRQSPDGVLLTAPLRRDPEAAFKRVIKTDTGIGKPILNASHGYSGQGEFKDWHDIDVIAAWTFIPGLNWGIVVKIDRSEAMERLLSIRNGLITGLTTITLLVLLGMWLYSRRITYPLIQLANAAAEVKGGRLDAYPASIASSNRETTILSDTFQHMAGDILQYQRGLEDQILARTTDLRRLQTAIEHSDNIVMITDRDAIIEYVNPAFERVSGYSANEAIGRPASLIKSGEMKQAFYQQMWNTILSGENWKALFINRNRAGHCYKVEQVISPIHNDKNQITGFVSVQRDVTLELKERKRQEHGQRLESLGVLAGGIAHDFNNLLSVIMGNSGMARKQAEPGSSLAARLDQIEKASLRAADLCKQMLAYSGKGSFIIEPVNLSQMIEESSELLRVSIGKQITLKCDLSANLPMIEADRSQLQQVIMNLLINASEAIGDTQGQIRISTDTMEADSAYLDSTYLDEELDAGCYILLEVSDNGCGMDKDTREKLFDPFFTTKFTGRGLGMSAILGIIRGHQGAINVYSEAGKGTTFKVLFPCMENSATSITEVFPEAGNLIPENWSHSGLILVVDDEEMVRTATSHILKQMGFDVLTACDGEDGVAQLRSRHQDIRLVILDLTMPVMDGKEAFRQMRLIQPDIKVLLSSGYNELDTTSQFAGKGLAGFIQKPYRQQTLRDTLQQILSD